MIEARRPALVLGTLAVVLLVLDRPVAAAIAVVAIAVAAQVAYVAPGLLTRVTRRVGDVAGRVVAVVLLVPLYALVFVPAAGVLRLLGVNALGASAGGWQGRGVARPVDPGRLFADDHRVGAPAPPGRSWRAGVALVALGALLATVVPLVLDRGDPESEVPTGLRGTGYDPFSAPALAGLDWTGPASAEFGEVSGGITATPFVGTSLRDHDGEYVNVHDRVRASYEAAPLDGVEPIDVWFLGGSTMFGFSAQRDEHTIPSEVVRLAEADGVAVRAHNYGAPGYVNFQETVLLAQLLSTGERPDLVVFYDGINDMALQIQQVFGGIGVPGDPSDLGAFPARDLLAGVLTGTGEPPAPLVSTPAVGRPPTGEDVARSLRQVLDQGLELADALGERYGFPVVHFWQPDLYNKAELDPGEDEVRRALGIDDAEYEASRRIGDAVLDVLPAEVVDISDAFDAATGPVLTDQVHTNEVGARLVAGAMYAELADQLVELADQG